MLQSNRALPAGSALWAGKAGMNEASAAQEDITAGYHRAALEGLTSASEEAPLSSLYPTGMLF